MNFNKEMEDKMDNAVLIFSNEQTLTNVGELKKLGIGLRVLKNNKWERLCEYKLPFERFIVLYDNEFKVSDIGVY